MKHQRPTKLNRVINRFSSIQKLSPLYVATLITGALTFSGCTAQTTTPLSAMAPEKSPFEEPPTLAQTELSVGQHKSYEVDILNAMITAGCTVSKLEVNRKKENLRINCQREEDESDTF